MAPDPPTPAPLPTPARATPDLRGGTVLMTCWREGDLDSILEIADDPASRAWSSTGDVHSVDDAREWVARRMSSADRVDWAIRDPSTERVIGRVGLGHFQERPVQAEIGYGVHPAHRRQGVAAAARRDRLPVGGAGAGLHRMVLRHAVGNPASCGVAIRCGFAAEGIERESDEHSDGLAHDMHRHARLADDPARSADHETATPVDPGVSSQDRRTPLDPVSLTADGLLLRPWRRDDAAAVLVGLGDPLTVRWNPRLPLPDLAAASAWIDTRTAGWAEGRAVTWAVCHGTEVIGSVGLRELNLVDAFAVASYWTMPHARGRGVAGRALARAAAYAHEDLGMHRLQLAHALANDASCRVATKAGFALEGTLRGSNRLAEGYVDEHLHARVVGDA